ncbi:MAG TPA: DUF983 domain-containing protein [Acidimicrobiales bacterium]|nr:DUF983 domain-containing protein [Acidimicrobiales bacterium]
MAPPAQSPESDLTLPIRPGDKPPVPLPTRPTMIRGFTLACPVCGTRGLFRRWVNMVERCPTCHLRFERIEGHWLGSLSINTVVSAVTLLALVTVAMVVTHADPPIPLLLGVCSAVAVVLPVLLFPFTRTIWSAVDLLSRPLAPGEVDPRYDPQELAALAAERAERDRAGDGSGSGLSDPGPRTRRSDEPRPPRSSRPHDR